jgi:hypothetical protein
VLAVENWAAKVSDLGHLLRWWGHSGRREWPVRGPRPDRAGRWAVAAKISNLGHELHGVAPREVRGLLTARMGAGRPLGGRFDERKQRAVSAAD